MTNCIRCCKLITQKVTKMHLSLVLLLLNLCLPMCSFVIIIRPAMKVQVGATAELYWSLSTSDPYRLIKLLLFNKTMPLHELARKEANKKRAIGQNVPRRYKNRIVFNVDESDNLAIFELKNVTMHDNDSYFGVQVDTKQTSSTAVRILEVVEQPRIKISQKPPTVKEGDNVTLLCQSLVKGKEKIYFEWVDSFNKTNSNTDGTLHLNSVTRNQSGHFTCVGYNHIGEPTEKYVILTVNYGPEIRTVVDVVYSSYLFLANITCTALGLPLPKVSIVYKNIVMNQGLSLVHHLISGNIGENHGNFSCVASNFVKTVNVSRSLINNSRASLLRKSTSKSEMTVETFKVLSILYVILVIALLSVLWTITKATLPRFHQT